MQKGPFPSAGLNIILIEEQDLVSLARLEFIYFILKFDNKIIWP